MFLSHTPYSPFLPMDYRSVLAPLVSLAGFGALSTPVTLAQDVSDVDQLDFRVTDVEYSDELERLVFVSSAPTNQVHIYDPLLEVDVTVDLPLAPTCVGVSLDGMQAAVGHNGWVSLVDLASGLLLDTFTVSTDLNDVVLGSNGFIYCFPRQNQWETIRCIEIATGVETTSGGFSIRAGTRVSAHPNGIWIYGADNGLSPSDIEKYDLTNGTARVLYDSPYHGDFAMCGNVWVSEDGLRLFTRCGNVFRSSAVQSEDMTYNGLLMGSGQLINVSHSSETDKVAALWSQDASEIEIYDYAFLTPDTTVQLPTIDLPSGTFSVDGTHVFFDGAGDRAFTVVQVDPSSGALYDYGVVRVGFDSGCAGSSERYCDAPINSSGSAASIDIMGSLEVADNTATLTVAGAPAGTFGLFLYGTDRGATPLGEGTLCIDFFQSPIHRLHGPVMLDGTGAASQLIDFPALPGNGRINGGTTHQFQFWFRDANAFGSSLSDAISVSFCD